MRSNPVSVLNDRNSRARLINVTDPSINHSRNKLRGLYSNYKDATDDSASAYKIREAFHFVNNSDAHKLEASFSNQGST